MYNKTYSSLHLNHRYIPRPGTNEAKFRTNIHPKSDAPLSPPFFVSLYAVPYDKKLCTAVIISHNKINNILIVLHKYKLQISHAIYRRIYILSNSIIAHNMVKNNKYFQFY